MMTGKTELSKDTRPIRGIFWNRDDDQQMVVDGNRISKIVVYDDLGPAEWMAWIAVYRGDEITNRIPAHHVEIAYQ